MIGNAGDSVTSTAQYWIELAQQQLDGQFYRSFTIDSTITLLVDSDMTISIS